MKKNSLLGFTLIEMLVVIFIIGILAGLLITSVMSVFKGANDTDIQQMCVQMADSWKSVKIDYGRFPYKDLIKENTEGLMEIDGDLCFPMTPKAGCLLNWWKPKNGAIPAYDKSTFTKYIKGLGSKFKWDDPTTWPNDTVYERSGIQKQFGIVAPWLENQLKEEQAATGTKIDLDNMMWVILDTNDDGKLSIPKNKNIPQEKIIDLDGNEVQLSSTAAAWLTNEDGEVITSW